MTLCVFYNSSGIFSFQGFYNELKAVPLHFCGAMLVFDGKKKRVYIFDGCEGWKWYEVKEEEVWTLEQCCKTIVSYSKVSVCYLSTV